MNVSFWSLFINIMTFITRPILAFTSLAIFSAQVSAIAQPYQVACDAIKAVAPTYYQGDDLYTEDAKNYWNAQLKAFLPACIIRPKNADQVSAAVKVLNKYPEVKFVVKSGGHGMQTPFTNQWGDECL